MEKTKKNMTEDIIEETQREAIVNRPYNLAGSVKRVETERFNISEDKIEWGTSNVVPALIKLFMEALDNPIDVAIKGHCNKINIKVDNKSIWVKDNGYGVSTKKDENGEYIAYKAFCKYNTSSNYKDKKGQGQKGVNGIGIKLCTTLSTRFEVITEDTNGRLQIIATDNNLHHEIKKLKRKRGQYQTGVEIYFEPDFKIFDVDEIDEDHINRMYEYTLMQALTYQDIDFTFNGKPVSINPKSFIKLLSEDSVIEEHDDYFFAILPNESGDFKQLSYVNGLEISKGGTHITAIIDPIVKTLRDKLVRRYKTIKPSDIKNKLMIVMVAKNMKHIDWEGQVKNNITSPISNMKEYFKDTDLDKVAMKVYKNKPIIDSIVDYFKIKEEYKKKKDLNKLNKKVKIRSEKFLPSIGKNKYLFIAEGDCLSENTEVLDGNYNSVTLSTISVGDTIISGDNTKQTIIAKSKLLKPVINVKTSVGEFKGTKEHRMFVYNLSERKFEYATIGDIKQNKENYKLVRSKIHNETRIFEVHSNFNNILECNDGVVVKYSDEDYFMIFRDDKIIRVSGCDITYGDSLILSN